MQNVDVPAWIGIIATLFVIVSAAAGAVSIAWSKATTSRQSLLEANNNTLADRVAILEEELKRERLDHKAELEKKDLAHLAEVTAYKTQTDSLLEKVAVLEKVVTGREQLELLTEMLVAHDKRVDTFFLQQAAHDTDAVARNEDLKGLMIANKRLLTQLLERMDHDRA
jgi:hypothetical protein